MDAEAVTSQNVDRVRSLGLPYLIFRAKAWAYSFFIWHRHAKLMLWLDFALLLLYAAQIILVVLSLFMHSYATLKKAITTLVGVSAITDFQ